MARLIVHQEKIDDAEALIQVCPFNAMEIIDGKVIINAGCKMCRACVKNGPPGAVEFVREKKQKTVRKEKWQGIAVYADHVDGKLHPVTFELIGKANELAKKVHQPVYVLVIGQHTEPIIRELQHYPVDKIFAYEDEALARFAIEPYTAVFEKFIKKNKPCAILVGATTVGRQLAPRVAARMRTGLTADCTVLDIDAETTDLSQIRPAFGGNIMAHILTPNHRPQMATVRYKVMETAPRSSELSGAVVRETIDKEKLVSNEKIIDIIAKEPEKFIDSADILVAAGRGVKKASDLPQLQELADALGGQLACSRPLAENGWLEAKHQIGLSGRTVRPKLIICCGISGAIQFVAGMDHSETIVAINSDPKAPIFKNAHYCLVGDLYEIIPQLLENIKAVRGQEHAVQNIH